MENYGGKAPSFPDKYWEAEAGRSFPGKEIVANGFSSSPMKTSRFSYIFCSESFAKVYWQTTGIGDLGDMVANGFSSSLESMKTSRF